MLVEIQSRHFKATLGPDGRRVRLHLDFDSMDSKALGRVNVDRWQIVLNLKNGLIAEADKSKNEGVIRLAATAVLADYAITSGRWEELLDLPLGAGAVGELAASVRLSK